MTEVELKPLSAEFLEDLAILIMSAKTVDGLHVHLRLEDVVQPWVAMMFPKNIFGDKP